jgi:two-component system, OmpR family, sensor kinase
VSLIGVFSRRLYLRIWLAVVGGVAVITLGAGWAWRIAQEQNAPPPPPREIVVRDEAGRLIGSAQGRPARVPGHGPEFVVRLDDGRVLVMQLPPRANRRPPGAPPVSSLPPWSRPPYGFLWMLGLVGLAVALGVYPIVRRLTQRLEHLQQGVQRWGDGDLSVRIPEQGEDEVADLARRFNAAAERVEGLLATQQHLLAAQRSLLANASHELRSPLARIRMGLELLAPGAQGATRNELSRSIAELDQLVDEILLASRLDAREADLGTVEAVDLSGLAAECCAATDAELRMGAGEPAVVVRGVARLLRRLVRNLLENARRYGGQGPATVELGREGAMAVLRVCDRGPGVPPSERERIFDPFYRLPGASEREGGVGLGLALVRSIAQRHDGEVRCVDHEGGGACFVVRLPLA